MRTVTPVFDEVATTSPGRVTRMNSYEAIKPVVDFTLAVIILMVSAPVVVVAMLLVKLSSRGPAIYTQARLGQGGKIFTIYKIRTMYLDSERHCGPTWSVPGDPRVTPVGRILRWCHVDELPQLVNILIGDMSLVGPRPERPEIAAKLEDELDSYPLRLAVRPGLTGLAQVQQPPDTGLESVRRKLNLRPLLHRPNVPLARPPPRHRHCPQMPWGPFRGDRLDPAVARSERPPRL